MLCKSEKTSNKAGLKGDKTRHYQQVFEHFADEDLCSCGRAVVA